MKKLSDFTVIGRIINTRGIKGEVKIYPLTSDINRFDNLKSIYVGEELEELKISKTSKDNRFIYIKFEEYDNINNVLYLKEKNIYVHDKDRIKLEEGTYFVSDIIGCKVFNLDNIELGSIVDFIDNPANDIYVLRALDGNEYLIPAVSAFIKEINIDDKTIVIDPIEGLIG